MGSGICRGAIFLQRNKTNFVSDYQLATAMFLLTILQLIKFRNWEVRRTAGVRIWETPHMISAVSKCQYVSICLVCIKAKGCCVFSVPKVNTLTDSVTGRPRWTLVYFTLDDLPKCIRRVSFWPSAANTNPIFLTLYINVLNKRMIVKFIRKPTLRKIYTPIPLSTLPWLNNQLSETGVESRQDPDTLISETAGPRLKPHQRPVKWAPGLFLKLNRLQREVSRSPQSSTEVQNQWGYTPTHPVRHHGVDRQNVAFRYTAWVTAVTRPWIEWLRNGGSIAGEKTIFPSPLHIQGFVHGVKATRARS